LLELVRYIHNNPVRSGLVVRSEQYRHGSQRAYLGLEKSRIVDTGVVLELIGGRKAYEKFIFEGRNEGHKVEYYEVEDQRILGEASFAERIRKEVKEDLPARPKTPLAEAFAKIAQRFDVEPAKLRVNDRRWETSKKRALVATILIRELGYGLTDVAKYLKRDPANVSTLMLRLGSKIEPDRR
jgi:putative transposase